MSKRQPKYLALGEILRPHGVRGELRMRVLTDYPERITGLDEVYLAESLDSEDAKLYSVKGLRMHKGYGLLTLKTIQDRNAADRLRGLFVVVGLEDAVPLEENEIYLFQLIGMIVQTEDGVALGTITDVIETGANDVYVVDSPRYGEILIPVIDEVIIETDVENEMLTVRLPDGLLPEDS